ncbi:calcium-binding protein [Tistrella sp. BH-R2-4]|uniref:Calcium-binding protein n=1 Tax=Tistrella arctica TaxID=3133430 RepID=A0ABU9YNE8_9PROT
MPLLLPAQTLADPEADATGFWQSLDSLDIPVLSQTEAVDLSDGAVTAVWRLNDRHLALGADFEQMAGSGLLAETVAVAGAYIVQRGSIDNGDGTTTDTARIVDAAVTPDVTLDTGHDPAPGSTLDYLSLDASALTIGTDDGGTTTWLDSYYLVVDAAPIAGYEASARYLVTTGDIDGARDTMWGDWLHDAGVPPVTPPAQALLSLDPATGWSVVQPVDGDPRGLTTTVTISAEGPTGPEVDAVLGGLAYSLREIGGTAVERFLNDLSYTADDVAAYRGLLDGHAALRDALNDTAISLPATVLGILRDGIDPGITSAGALIQAVITAISDAQHDAQATLATGIAALPLPGETLPDGWTAEALRGAIVDRMLSGVVQYVVQSAASSLRVDVIGDGQASPMNVSGAAAMEFGAILGGTGDDALTGSVWSDMILGGGGADILNGGGGSDLLAGGDGADIIDGGDGFDLVSHAASTAAVRIDLASGIISGGDAEGDALTGIEGVLATDFNDVLNGSATTNLLTGLGGDDVLRGRGGADILDGGNGFDTISYTDAKAAVRLDLMRMGTQGDAAGDYFISIEAVNGSHFNDLIEGDAASNTLAGFGGDDVLRGRGGADTFDGGDGFDTVSYTDAAGGVIADLILGGTAGDAASDRFIAIEAINGSHHDDLLTGNAGDNTLAGFGGDDVLRGRGGADKLDGGDGIDTVSYAGATEALRVDLSTGIGMLGDAEGDRYIAIEAVDGGNAADLISGTDDMNLLNGFRGNDALRGRGGADSLSGGAGADRFVYEAVTDSIMTARDRIIDFSGAEGDRVDLSLIDARPDTAGNDAFSFVGTGGYTGVGGQVRVATYSIGIMALADIDGDRRTDFAVALEGVFSLTDGDFIL